MRYIILGAGIGCLVAAGILHTLTPPKPLGFAREMQADIPTPSVAWTPSERLLKSVAYVESRNNPKAFNKHESAHGLYQIKGWVAASMGYRVADCYDPARATWMIKDYWTRVKVTSDEEACRLWNGGSSGMSKHCTLGYWNRVRNHMSLTLWETL